MSQPTTVPPGEPASMAVAERRARFWRWIAVLTVGLVLIGIVALVVWNRLFREVPSYYADETDHFKYGSIGNEADQGIPYWIWLSLPRIFPEHLPGNGGYAAVGMVFEPGEWKENRWIGGEVPVGMSKKTIGFPRVAMNCAMCHATSVREPGQARPKIYVAGPSHQLNSQAYLRFLFKCAHDDKFTADNLLAQMGYDVELDLLDQFLYRYFIIPGTRKALLDLEKQYAWMETRPDWGRGRIDPFNPVKYNVLKMPWDDTIGNADMPPIWNMKAHDGFAYHWDGLNSKIHEVVLSSAIGDGSTLKSIDLDGLKRVEEFILNLPAPKYPFPIDDAKADKGAAIYQQKCAECHAFDGARTGKIAKVDEVGTDGERHRLWTDDAAAHYNAYAKGYPWKFNNFVGTDGPDGGYVNVPLDAVWLRAPYLHNGSVPSLRDLLKKPADRPKEFWRGNDLYDPIAVGFDSYSDEARKAGTHYETNQKGNGNGGHIFGTDLPEDQKDALVEYLKKL
jgi:hypothetical protein